MYLNAKGIELPTSAATNNNIISGAAGSVRNGTAKNDAINSIKGDTLVGGLGDDSYNLWDANSKIIEKPGEGIDTVYVKYWGGYQMADNVENVILANKGANWVTGNALNNIIIAGATGAAINGGAGDDVLVGGAGADTFTIQAGNGSDAIMNFQPGWDIVKLEGYGISSFAQLQKLASQTGSDVTVKLSGSESLVIRDVKLNALSAADFNLPMTQATSVTADKLLTTHTGWNANSWYVVNNDWNVEGLTRGKDYTLTSAFTTKNMASGTVFNWNFPVSNALSPKILAYPEVIFGSSPLSGSAVNPTDTHVFPIKVSDIRGLTASHDVTYAGNMGGFNVSYDIFLSNSTQGVGKAAVSNEVMVWVHKPDFVAFGDVIGKYSKDGFSATIYHTGTYTALVADKDMPVGTIDIADIFKVLKGLGVIADTEYLRSVELGAEVVSGAGSLKVNDLTLKVATDGTDGGTKVTTVTGSGTSVVDSNPAKAAMADIKAAVAATSATAAGLTVNAKMAASDADHVTISRTDMAKLSLGYDEVVRDGNRITTRHFDGAGKLSGSDRADYAADGSVTTHHFDRYGAFLSADLFKTDATGAVTDHHYDVNWAFTGADRTTTAANGAVTIQHYDANWALLSFDKTSVAGSKTTIEHYNAKSALTGVDRTTVGSDGSTTAEHFDKNWKMTSADLVKAPVDGVIKTYHYDAKYALTGSEVATVGADGVTKTLTYDKAYKLVSTDLQGTDRADTLVGSKDMTHFHGGLGSDTLIAGSGVDHFHFDTAIGQGDVDTIVGFKGGMDKIVFDHTIFKALGGAGALDASMFKIGTSAGSANDHVIFDKVKGDLYYDVDGSGAQAAVLIAHVHSDVALTASDFLVI